MNRFSQMHNDYLDPDRHNKTGVNKPKRFLVVKTDQHWDSIWGVLDTVTNQFVYKDIRKHCTAKAKELNGNA